MDDAMTEYINRIILGDCLETLKTIPNECVNTCVTSPPYYGLRDYGVDGQIGLEQTPQEYVDKLVAVFRDVKRVLRDDGTLWLNLGDSYWNNFGGGSGTCTIGNVEALKARGRSNKPKSDYFKIKDLIGIPWMVANALRDPVFKCSYCGKERRFSEWSLWDNGSFQICGSCGRRCAKQPQKVSDGWYLRQDIIWHKPNPMPESVTDRCTKSHEYIFLLSKSPRYYYNGDAIAEKTTTFDSGFRDRDNSRLNNTPGRTKMGGLVTNDYETRNKRSVWTVNTKPCSLAHFATFPEDLIRPCILAGCPPGGIVLDPFSGAGTTALVAKKNGCHYIGCELNPKYIEISDKRLSQDFLF